MTVEMINAQTRLEEIIRTDAYRVMEAAYGHSRTLWADDCNEESEEIAYAAHRFFRDLHLEIDALKAVINGLYPTYEEALPRVTESMDRITRENAELAAAEKAAN